MSMLDKIDQLETLISDLPANKQEFGSSLCSQFRKYGRLSDKQAYWIDVLIDTARTPQQPKAELPNLLELHRMTGDRRMAQFEVSPEWTVKIKRPVTGPNKDAVTYVTDLRDGYYGKVMPDGTFMPSGQFRRLSDDMKGTLMAGLKDFEADPVGLAKAYARKHCVCSFCGRELTDPRSRAVLYGPICAERWSLPWG